MERASEELASTSSRRNWLTSPEFKELQHAFAAYREQAVKEDAMWWEGLSYEDQLKAFRCVCRRIYEGDVKHRGSYRHVLYDTFGFGPDSYADGMDCGYMTIHNLIWEGIEAENAKKPLLVVDDEQEGSDSKSLLQQEQAQRQ